MQQRTRRRLAVFVGGALLALVGVLAACSTDNGATPLPGQTGTDSGHNTPRPDSGDGEDGDDASTPLNDGGGADCGLAPRLRSNDRGGFFCSFYSRDAAAGDAGGRSNCADDETCCNPGRDGKDFPSSFCAQTDRSDKGGDNGQAACAEQAEANDSKWVASGSSTWECGDKNNCAEDQVCCLVTWMNAEPTDKVNIGNSLDEDIPKACGALQAFKQGGTKCAASCAADQIQLCSQSDNHCTGNQVCTPFSALFRDLAYCK